MIEEIIEVLRGSTQVVISTHVRPDGDAIGSQLALGLFLRALGKDVTMINRDAVPATLAWMEGAEEIEVFEGHFNQLRCLNEAEVVVLVDLNAGRRLGRDLESSVRDCTAIKVLIDHHRQPESWFDYRLVREGTAATGMLVYELIMAWNPALLDGTIATALYVAILTDTGMFRYATTTPAVHRVAADLLERGSMKPSQVYGEIYETRDPQWPRLLARVMNTLTLRYDGKLAYLIIAQHALEEVSAEYQDTEGFVDFAMSVDGVQIALVFTETRRGTKVSFRSKRNRAVDQWARSLGGGGHRNAAGAFVRGGHLEQVIRRVVASAPRYTGFRESNNDPELVTEDEFYLTMLTRT